MPETSTTVEVIKNIGQQPEAIISQGYSLLEGRAGKMTDLSLEILEQLKSQFASFEQLKLGLGSFRTDETFEVDLEGTEEGLQPFSVENVPRPEFSYSELLGDLGITPIQVPEIDSFGELPVFDTDSPEYTFPDKPQLSPLTVPGKAPTIANPIMPMSPDLDLPPVPTLHDISLPTLPDIILPTFAGVSPSADIPELVAPNFAWSEADYAEKLPALAGKMAQYLAFDFDAAETAIWERGQERVDRATNEAANAIAADFAARGFSLPPGSMLAAINEARMKGAEARYDNARDAMIKAAELNTQKLTLAIQSGIQYEGMWMQHNAQYLQRSFEAHKYAAELATKVMELKISRFNIRLQAYQIEAQVHRDLIQGELAKLETYKAQLEGQKIIGELNVQDVELYKAQLQGVVTEIELYKNQVQAVVATIEADKARMQGYESEVNAYKTMVEANTEEYRAWGEQVKVELTKGQAFEYAAKAFALRSDGYKTGVSAQLDIKRLALENNAQKLQEFNTTIAKFNSELDTYKTEIAVETKKYDAHVQHYDAVIKLASFELEKALKTTGFYFDMYKQKAMLELEEAKVDVQMTQENTRMAIEKIKLATQTFTQLAASSMAAFNLSASTSYNGSQSISNSLQESYSASV